MHTTAEPSRDHPRSVVSPSNGLILLFAIVYFVAAGISQWPTLGPGLSATLWYPSGLAVAVFLASARSSWPRIALATLLADLAAEFAIYQMPLLVGLTIGVGNTFETLCGAFLVRRFCGPNFRFDRARDVLVLMLCAALLSPVIGASIGSAALAVAGIQPFVKAWPFWWISDAVGVLIVAPLATVIIQKARSWRSIAPIRWLEAGIVSAVLALLAHTVFSGSFPFTHIILPPLLWAALRFGMPGAALTMVILTAIAVTHTARGSGPYVGPSITPGESVLLVQSYLGILGVSASLLAALTTQRRAAVQFIKHAHDQLESRVAERTASLRESEERFRTIFEQAAVGVALTETTTGRNLRVNHRYCEIVGRSADQLLNLTFMAITHPDDLPVEMERMRQLSAGEIRSFSIEKRYILPDQSVVWVNLTVSPMWPPGGTPTTHIAIVQNITEQKHAEEERQKFVSLADSSQEFIGMCDRDFTPFYINDAGLRMVGLPSFEAARGLKVHDYFFAEDHAFLTDEFFPRVLRDGHGEVEIRFRHRVTGEPIWMLYNVFNIHDAASNVVGWATVSRNIHQRKMAEERLRESEERLRLSAEATGFGTYDYDPARRSSVWSAELHAITGLIPAPAVHDETFNTLIHPEDRALYRAALRRALDPSDHQRLDIEFRITRPDGQPRWLQSTGRTIFHGEGSARRAIRLVGTVQDITPRKQIESRQRLMMRELDHRVKNNLAAVISLAEYTAANARDLQHFREAFLGRIDALARAHSLLARTQWGGMRLRELIDHSLSAFVGADGRGIILDGPDGMLPARVASPLCIALNELATNAAKYGALSTTQGAVHLTWTLEGPSDRPTKLMLNWRESGGPFVSPPVHTGFGTTLIRDTLTHDLGALVNMNYDQGGLVCTMNIDLARAAAAEAAQRLT